MSNKRRLRQATKQNTFINAADERPTKRGFYNGRCGSEKVPCVLYFDDGVFRNEDMEVIKNIYLYEWLKTQ